jgi:simple sugar transport system permease protein
MLNWTAFYVSDYLISGPYKAPQQANQTSSLPAQATLPRISIFYNETLGKFLPQIPQPEQYLVDVSIIFSLIALLIYWFIIRRTTFGYEIRVIGQNPKAAQYAGIPVKRNITISMALAGAFAGLAGSLHLMGQFPNQLIGTTFALDTTGFDAIGVALLGNNTPIGILLSSLFFGGLRQGGNFMQINTNVPIDIYRVIEALVLLFITARFLLPKLQRYISGGLRFNRQAAPPGADQAQFLVPAAATTEPVIVDLPDNGNNPLPPGSQSEKVEEK